MRDSNVQVASVTKVEHSTRPLNIAIRGDGDPLLGRVEVVAQARAIEALYRAAEDGVTVELP